MELLLLHLLPSVPQLQLSLQRAMAIRHDQATSGHLRQTPMRSDQIRLVAYRRDSTKPREIKLVYVRQEQSPNAGRPTEAAVQRPARVHPRVGFFFTAYSNSLLARASGARCAPVAREH